MKAQDDLQEMLAEEMKDGEFRREWELLKPEFEAIRAQLRSEQASAKQAPAANIA